MNRAFHYSSSSTPTSPAVVATRPPEVRLDLTAVPSPPVQPRDRWRLANGNSIETPGMRAASGKLHASLGRSPRHGMDSLTDPRKSLEVPESPPKLKLTVTDTLEDLPIAGVWSRGPVYQPLDPDFLAQPRIPKAPPTPRLQIDRINGSLRVVDTLAQLVKPSGPTAAQRIDEPEISPHAPTLPNRQRRTLAQFARERRYRLVALVVGFGAGIAVAMLLHVY